MRVYLHGMLTRRRDGQDACKAGDRQRHGVTVLHRRCSCHGHLRCVYACRVCFGGVRVDTLDIFDTFDLPALAGATEGSETHNVMRKVLKHDLVRCIHICMHLLFLMAVSVWELLF